MKVKIDECICCTNTDLYVEGKIHGLHCSHDEESIGKKCTFCDGTFIKREYWVDFEDFEIKEIGSSNTGGKN